MADTAFVNDVTLTDANWFNDVNTTTYNLLSSVAGTNTITATGPTTLLSYSSGQIFRFVPANTNTGTTTLNISSLGAKNIYLAGVACVGGELVAGVPALVSYDGTQFNLMNPAKPVALNVADQPVTGGVVITSNNLGTISSGTVTPDPGARPFQHYTNGGAHILAPHTNVGSTVVDVTNNASAGAITTSGFTIVTGAFDTTNAHKFRCFITIGNGGSLLQIQALQ